MAVDPAGAMRHLVVGAAPPGAATEDRPEPMRRAMSWHLRDKALKAWTPRGCDAPGLRVSTGDHGPRNRARRAALRPNLRSMEVSVPHEHPLEGEALDVVVDVLATAVRGRVLRHTRARRAGTAWIAARRRSLARRRAKDAP